MFRLAALALEAFLPAGGMAGSDFSAEAIGKLDRWPAEVWCSRSGIDFVADEEKENRYRVRIDHCVEPGAVLVRVGGSAPVTFVVGAAPEINEVQSTLAEPQTIAPPLPVVVNGHLAKGGEVDFYAIGLGEGETLNGRLDGSALGSPIDPHIIVYDATGARLALANDSPGSIDPELEFVAPASGRYTLAVMAFQYPPSASVEFTGKASAVYRLHLSLGRSVAPPMPMPTLPLAAPLDVAASLHPAGYPVFAREGERWVVRATAPDRDLVLRIASPDGRLLKEVDDVGGRADPEWLWEVDKSGVYTIATRDRFGRSMVRGSCRLSLTEPLPAVEATADEATYRLEAGGESAVKITLGRTLGHRASLAVEPGQLPDGVVAEIAEIPEGDGVVTMTLRAAADAPASSAPWAVRLTEATDAGPAVHDVFYRFPSEEPRTSRLVRETADLWLTVLATGEP